MLVRVVLLALVSLLLAPAATPASAADPRPVELLPGNHFFSPNGDGRKDRLPVKFQLREKARVTVQVRTHEPRKKVRTEALGMLGAGKRVWRWDGRNDAGRRVPNGSYVIRVTAEGAHQTGSATRRVGIDRGEGLRSARVWLSRDTVYPNTPDFEDRIHIRSTTGLTTTRLAIRDADGDVVRRTGVFGWASWAGRDDDGALLPPGEYDARFMFGDWYGNRRTTHRTFTISDEVLEPRTWSTTVRAADAELSWPDGYCPPTPSERFEGGMTVAVTDGCSPGFYRPEVEVPFRLDPSSSWRVSVTGGPTVPGEADPARIMLSDEYSTLETPTVPGDGTTTTPWGRVTETAWALPPNGMFYVAVGDPDTSYDVAEFTVEVRYWEPAG